jgi:hypothetical protein
MSDSRLPDSWLGNPRFDEMSDETWRVWCGGLMWSNRHGTDGLIPKRYLKVLHPDGEKRGAASWLSSKGFWLESGENYAFTEWVKFGQETAAVIAQNKESNRLRQQKYRDSLKDGQNPVSPKPKPKKPQAVTRDIARDVGQDTTETETGTGLVNEALSSHESVNPSSGEVAEWDVAPIPGSHPEKGAAESATN